MLAILTLSLICCKTEIKQSNPNHSLIAQFNKEVSKSINLVEIDIFKKGVPQKYKENNKLSKDAIANVAAANILNYRVKVMSTKECLKELAKDSSYNYSIDSVKMITIEKHFENLNTAIGKSSSNPSFMIISERIDLLTEHLNKICHTEPKVEF